MLIGASQIDITPSPGLELAGYAARVQPSLGTLSPLYVKALYIQTHTGKLLWLASDLLALSEELVDDLRSYTMSTHHLTHDQVLLTASHTHSAPATIHLTSAGRPDAAYISSLQDKFRAAADAAIQSAQPATLRIAEASLDIAIDRRNQPTSQTDPKAFAIAFYSPGNLCLAAALNYPMHPVALGHINRLSSPDWPGYATDHLTQSLPGSPITLFANGAAGNLNPPLEGGSPAEVISLGRQVADSLIPLLSSSLPLADPIFRTAISTVRISLETLTPAQMSEVVNAELGKIPADHPWFEPIREATNTWLATSKPSYFDVTLQAIRLGPLSILAINGEPFSHLTNTLRAQLNNPHLYTFAYANHPFGYLPHAAAYDEGGYETDSAHFFYNSFRPSSGTLEILATHAANLLNSLFSE